jgi:hypothetical protein
VNVTLAMYHSAGLSNKRMEPARDELNARGSFADVRRPDLTGT